MTSGTSRCDDGSVCREGTVCHTVGEVIDCVTPDQIVACDGLEQGAACNGDSGTCFSGACLPAGCGNGRQEGAEDCDDGNNAFGDAFSPSCRDVRCGNGELDPFVVQNGTPVPLEQRMGRLDATTTIAGQHVVPGAHLERRVIRRCRSAGTGPVRNRARAAVSVLPTAACVRNRL